LLHIAIKINGLLKMILVRHTLAPHSNFKMILVTHIHFGRDFTLKTREQKKQKSMAG
jgi:hypothetical protein